MASVEYHGAEENHIGKAIGKHHKIRIIRYFRLRKTDPATFCHMYRPSVPAQ
jgi:hypothetical protein